ncbi:rna-directed dna polymerase from mobile element jockey-like [Willisornis vidua]|uniref:Rna-directed dna polymerase from mobile element jockey-like n=1 Tax=Willisornis vidua TaxID=1566151 RepID=A0ABQ9D8F0_9PASS|nr:rna-directed dna polymerase from mobile element jockey-like [Willisornis vidua]
MVPQPLQGPQWGKCIPEDPRLEQRKLVFPCSPFQMSTLLETCFLSKLADDTKLRGVTNTPEDCTVLQKDLNRLKRWAGKSCLRFHKGKCRVLHLGRSNPFYQDRLVTNLQESSSVEKDLGVLVDNKLSVSQQ